MTPPGRSDAEYIGSVKATTEELGQVLAEFSGRLRRMRQRNRQTQQEIESFQQELDELASWLEARTEGSS